ncbi:NAD(+) synthase, partial [Corallococcus praedator]
MTAREYSDFGYLRVAVVAPELRLGDPGFNARCMIESLEGLVLEGCSVAVFPELCLTGYSTADLFFQQLLLDAALE